MKERRKEGVRQVETPGSMSLQREREKEQEGGKRESEKNREEERRREEERDTQEMTWIPRMLHLPVIRHRFLTANQRKWKERAYPIETLHRIAYRKYSK